MLKELIGKACRLVEKLGLHYRLSKLAAGDCSCLHGYHLRYRTVDSQHERIQGVLLRFQRA